MLVNEHPDDGAASAIDAFAPSRLPTTVSRLALTRAKGFLEEKFLRIARDRSLGSGLPRSIQIIHELGRHSVRPNLVNFAAKVIAADLDSM